MNKLYDNVGVYQSIAPQTGVSSDVTGSSVDTQGFYDGMLVVNAGSLDDADGDETYEVKLQESDDDSTWEDSGISITLDRTDDENAVRLARVKELNVVRSRYLRAQLVVDGTTPSADVSAEIALGEPTSGPVNTD